MIKDTNTAIGLFLPDETVQYPDVYCTCTNVSINDSKNIYALF